MSYTALYRRFRPARFQQLVGQEPIARVLAAAISSGSFVHAYLLSGPRGTGKTSAARILARAINCHQPLADGNPCGNCPSCLRFERGESMDIIEIDGASNRGIDEIRDLRERVKYAPAQEKYKVYIIDEVHMLTNDAFNALLKTLEEPPAHVVFIFATTAPHKLPPTVISRCQRFEFRRIGEQAIADHLLAIAAQEGVDLSLPAAQLIARKAEGGMRDAVSLLDQCGSAAGMRPHTLRPGQSSGDEHASNTPGEARPQISVDTVLALLGAVDSAFTLDLLRLLLTHDTAAALQKVDQLIAAGKDLRQAVDDLLTAARDILLLLLSPQTAAAALPAWARDHQPAAYLALLQSLSDLDSRLRYALSPRITLELALIKAAASPLLTGAACCAPADPDPAPTSAAKAAKPKPAAPAAAPADPDPAPTSAAKAAKPKPAAPAPAPADPDPDLTPAAKAAKPKPAAPVPAPAAAPMPDIARVRACWPQILAAVAEQNAGAFNLLNEALPHHIEGQTLMLDFPPALSLFMSSVLSPERYKTMIEASLAAVLGAPLKLGGFIGAERAPAPEPREETPPAAAPADPGNAVEEGSLF